MTTRFAPSLTGSDAQLTQGSLGGRTGRQADANLRDVRQKRGVALGSRFVGDRIVDPMRRTHSVESCGQGVDLHGRNEEPAHCLSRLLPQARGPGIQQCRRLTHAPLLARPLPP
jgi:hypothetical protein